MRVIASSRATGRAWPVHRCDGPCSPAGQGVRIELHDRRCPGAPALHSLSACARRRSGSMRTLMRNISLSRSLLVSTVLGVNCA